MISVCIAIRAALGAGSGRVLHQLLTESTVLSLAGGVFGLLLALWGTHVLAGVSRANLPRVDEIKLAAGVFVFTRGLSLLTGLGFGFAPARQSLQADVNDALKDGGRAGSSGFRSHGLRNYLVVSEIALSLVLLVSAGLLIHSFVRLLNVDVGFEPERVLARHLSFRHPHYRSHDVAVRLNELLERLRAIPGVRSVGVNRLRHAGSRCCSSVYLRALPWRWHSIFQRTPHHYFGNITTPIRRFELARIVLLVFESGKSRFHGCPRQTNDN